ncbi:VirB4 family type IV secretion/conjugal transfer ATPase [Rickettsiales endosymbiont of Peranema trichophorum]|uniref:VirB4 family type IV secretion/conjugal transfer ATPase n=1 Tax=Rickettsiales endosymbiont of Peranema trichophorum TaxID=2486577 RepID=UPI001023B6DE|nr:VirB4 family type IV secretion/conjugal transfer ATPase [Rickettsiales endosymbiont of Peranema trichophorum]RZI46018.1 VirB4 family type IV secretion/conjugal transfer ATPase [Rickettsiales endosymbiont of Peranema trichophorum]
MLKFFKTYAERERIARSEHRSCGFMPYLTHWNANTLITKDDELLQVIKVGGFSFETADDEDLDIKKMIRNQLFKGMAAGNLGLYFHIIRQRHQVYPDDYASVDMPDGFALYLDQKWFEKNKNKNAFVNKLYISVVRKAPGALSIDIIGNVAQKIFQDGGKDAWASEMQEAYEQLEEATARVINTLREYSPRTLSLVETPNGTYSEICEFLYSIVNCCGESRILYPSGNIAEQLNTHRLYFGKKAIEAKAPDGNSKFAGIVSIKEYGPKTWAGLMDGFLKMPFEFIVTQSFEFSNRQVAINKMQLQQNRMIQSEDKAVSQVVEISEALDKAMSGEISFGSHHISVMCIADSIKELENILSLAAVELTNTGGIGIRETVNMEPAFWGQLPCNYDFVVRKATINTLNLAAFNSLHNYPSGKQKGNLWGDAVTVLDTTSGTPYYFNFHLRDVGHTTIIGPTGTGKTVMMNFLCAQAQKFKCRLFFFDKDRGAEIFLRALNGKYTIIDPGKPCRFNPLLLPDNGDNRTFLLDWMKQLVSVNGEAITSEDMSLINDAISGNYKLDKKDRKLRNIAPFLGIGGPGTLAGRISMWHGDGSHANIFDNDEDMIDFSRATVFGFEMAELLKDKASLGPVLSYVFHRINISLDGTPSMIVLDEAWALIDNPIFAPKIKDWLKVLRKLNTFMVFATQSVEDASKSSISDTLIQQTATQIFLPNLKATELYRKAFMLSEREYTLIKTTDPGSRYFLIKQGNDAIVAKIDLSGMEDAVNILSGRAETVVILDEVRNQYGDDPKVWLPMFQQRIKERKA